MSRAETTIVSALTSAIRETVAAHGRCRIAGLGVFSLRTRKARRIRNPITGDMMQLQETKTVHFRPSKEWREAL